jgi:hypothetical protein
MGSQKGMRKPKAFVQNCSLIMSISEFKIYFHPILTKKIASCAIGRWCSLASRLANFDRLSPLHKLAQTPLKKEN